jgi:hypothetical protein
MAVEATVGTSPARWHALRRRAHPHRLQSSSGSEVRADEQDVVVGVCSRLHPRRGRAKRAGTVHLLTPGILVRRPVGASPEAEGRRRADC